MSADVDDRPARRCARCRRSAARGTRRTLRWCSCRGTSASGHGVRRPAADTPRVVRVDLVDDRRHRAGLFGRRYRLSTCSASVAKALMDGLEAIEDAADGEHRDAARGCVAAYEPARLVSTATTPANASPTTSPTAGSSTPSTHPHAGRGTRGPLRCPAMDTRAYSRSAGDHAVATGDRWTVPVGLELIAAARAGDGSICSRRRHRFCAHARASKVPTFLPRRWPRSAGARSFRQRAQS
jgi:hypothetical protein